MSVLARLGYRQRSILIGRALPRIAKASCLAVAIASFSILAWTQTSRVAQAQGIVTFVAATPAPASGEKPNASFTLPTQPNDVKDAIDEFRRLVEHEAWEKAFKSLDTITSKTGTGYIDRSDGVLVPSRMLVRGLLASMPTAGKNAYRVFYDSQATALWDQANGRIEQENLTKIVANHLISSVGDRAADRLGDLYFEQGDFEQAASAWQSIVTFCPESKLPKAQSLMKIAFALARAGRWSEFAQTEQSLRERYANETIEIGGRRVAVADQLAQLSAGKQTQEPAEVVTALPDVRLPAADQPSWQFRYQTKTDPNNPANPFTLMDVYGRQRANDFPIPCAIDDKRVYVNLFGVEMAFDLESGKLVWRSAKLQQLQNLQQGRQGVAPERYWLMVHGDRTWSVTRDPQQANQQQGNFALVVRESATGKEVFNSRRALSAWNIIGRPLPVGEVVYVGAHRSNQGRELAVLMLNAKDGKLLKTINVGNHTVDQNQIYTERIAQPSLMMHRDRLYIETHAGALVSLQPQTGNFDWAVLYDSPAPQAGYWYYDASPPQFSVADPIYASSLLFAKGMRSTRLLGVQPDGATMAWKRPVSKTAMVVGVDEKRIYLGGEELTAYDLQTQELIWSARLPHSASWSTPILTQNRLYQFTARGVCEVDKQTGDLVKIFRGVDLDSVGGVIFVTPKSLLTVSNLAITAYPLEASAPAQPAP